MPHLTAIYGRSHTAMSILLRNADRWGAWSHVGILTPENVVIEATFWNGVIDTPRHEFEARYTKTMIAHRKCPRPADGLAWARSQIGMPYDTLAILGNVCRESWQDDGAWQCAELFERAMAEAGRARFVDNLWRISPALSAKVI